DTNSISALFTFTTNTYSPYVRINQDEGDPGDDPLFRGQDYQEGLSNFPLVSQILTGLFLDVSVLFPAVNGERKTETVEKELVDRIGFVARHNGGISALNLTADTPPVVSNFDIVTLAISTSKQDKSTLQARQEKLKSLANDLTSVIPFLQDADKTQQTQAV